MDAVNARAFARPGMLQRALGHGSPGLIGGQKRSGKTGGITHHKVVTLAPGTLIVRFGQKRAFNEFKRGGKTERIPVPVNAHGLFAGVIAGEWWLEEEEFDAVETYAHEQRISLGNAVRALCVVPPEWSDLDMIVEARLKSPLMAYRGSPNPGHAGGRMQKPMRDNHNRLVKQLFIPGLGNPDVVHDALMIERQTSINARISKVRKP